MAIRGKVYFIGSWTAIKIGYSGAPIARLRTIQGYNPEPLKLIDQFPGTEDDERAVHKHFDDIRVRGEWFKKEPKLLAFIETLPHYRKRLTMGRTTITKILAGGVPMIPPMADFPRDPQRFSAWADQQCRFWPAEMQVKACHAGYELDGRTFAPPGSVDKFAAAYSEWEAV